MKAPGSRKPDFERFRRAVTTNEPGPVPVGDIFADIETIGNFLKEPVMDLTAYAENPNIKIGPGDIWKGMRALKQAVRWCCMNGWDYAFGFSVIPFPGMPFNVNKNTSTEVKDGKRAWMDDYHGPIKNWEDFEKYKWPANIKAINAMSRYMAKKVPDGMKVMVVPGGVFEWATWLMGFVNFSYALYEEPELIDAIIEKVSDLIYLVVEDLMYEPNIGGIFMGDDLGYSTGTMISPALLREKFFPNTKKIVDVTKEAGGVFVYHSCGNLEKVMDDICDLGIHAKHSFEDKLMPPEEAHSRWGDRIAIIGGVDMDLMASGTEEAIRKRTREILDACAPTGHYVLGTGNSVANYIPLKNYDAMLDEGRKWNMEHFGREY